MQKIVEQLKDYFSDDSNFIACQIEQNVIKLYFDNINYYKEIEATQYYPRPEIEYMVKKHWHGEFNVLFGDGDTMVIYFE